MATWQKEIMKLANDFCLKTAKVKEIVQDVDTLTTPSNRNEEEYKYNKAYSRIKPLIMAM